MEVLASVKAMADLAMVLLLPLVTVLVSACRNLVLRSCNLALASAALLYSTPQQISAGRNLALASVLLPTHRLLLTGQQYH